MTNLNQLKPPFADHLSMDGLKSPINIAELETTKLEDVNMDEESFPVIDPNFQTELDYDGYQNIADYDNNAYNFDVSEKDNPAKELILEERAELDSDEEDAVDPQGNHK